MGDILERRRSGINHVAKVFEDVHNLGKQFNVKLEEQGEMLDNIWDNLEDGANNMKKGGDELDKYHGRMGSKIKKMIVCLIILLALLGVLIYFIVG